MTIQLEAENTIASLSQQIKLLLINELGTFQNGLPALWVEPPESPKSGAGLHVYLSRFYQQLSKVTYQWQIRVVQLDLTLDGMQALDRAIEKLRQKFPNRREVILPYAENRYPSANFYIPFNLASYSHLN